MKKNALLWLMSIIIFGGCAKMVLPPVSVEVPDRTIDYLTEVKPILDKRCVVCHSCYNSPCQLKLSSFEGTDRGATKEAVYNASRLKTMDPTRLFFDAKTTEQWQLEKGFHSVTESSVSGNLNDSLMLQLLSHKMNNPVSTGDYFPEKNDLTCAEDNEQIGTYLQKHPNNGMPFGFPPLKEEDFQVVAGWLAQGANGPSLSEQTLLETVESADGEQIREWEVFLNTDNAKHAMTARYLYEHLFLAHIKFDTATNDYYELVRSSTPPGEPLEVIATVRPYDNPGASVYYRFRKIYSTIVHKTHMVFELSGPKLVRIKELFIEPEWMEEPYRVGYEPKKSANPFITFEQIPTRYRYQFLLDNAHYIIMTFIRGPVCKGQVALNVIHDHFWVMFLDPETDLSVRYPAFLKFQRENLRMPVEVGSGMKIIPALESDYRKAANRFYRARQNFYASHYYNGLGYNAIWKGNTKDDTPLLTVFRHFDSASVHKGVLGDLPRTLWVIDYPLLERIYYSLVAGFDVYGVAGHQLAVRLYMDGLRKEGESYFLNFLPQNLRQEIMQKWYVGINFNRVGYHNPPMPTDIEYQTAEPKREFVEHVVENLPESLGIVLDPVNYLPAEGEYPPLPEKYEKESDYLQAFHSIARPGNSFFTYVTDNNANVVYVRIRLSPTEDTVISIVIHRWHDNVAHLFGEERSLDPEKDTADFLQGFIGSYPNYFFDVTLEELPEFIYFLKNFTGSDDDVDKLGRFGVNRANENFWETFDWFQQHFLESKPVRAGLFDLNRYYHRAM